MQRTQPTSPSVVVGIDGSRTSVTAALWAVDEAVQRDIPIRLVYAIEPSVEDDAEQAARRLATAELAVRHAFTAVQSTDQRVKIEVEILQGRTTAALLEASRSAAMICVGSMGLRRATGRIGSTAAALASSAHCPVAIIRSMDVTPTNSQHIVVAVDKSDSDTDVLGVGIAEARLRGAPLQVVTTWQSQFTDVHDVEAIAEGNRRVEAQLDRRLAWWRRRNPDLEIESVVAHCTTLHYLIHHAKHIQLVVIGEERAHLLASVAGQNLEIALHDTNCSVLLCPPHNAL